LTFPVTPTDTWADAALTLPLVAGNNTIVAPRRLTGGDPNLDYRPSTARPTRPRVRCRATPVSRRAWTLDSSEDFSWDARPDHVAWRFYDVYHDGQLITRRHARP